jgi:hypothetical protein
MKGVINMKGVKINVGPVVHDQRAPIGIRNLTFSEPSLEFATLRDRAAVGCRTLSFGLGSHRQPSTPFSVNLIGWSAAFMKAL